jgi:hypothetical protein
MRVNAILIVRFFPQTDARRGFDDQPFVSGVFDQNSLERFISSPVENEQVRFAQFHEVLWGGLVRVRVNSDGQERFHLKAITCNVARDVRQEGGGRQDNRSRLALSYIEGHS